MMMLKIKTLFDDTYEYLKQNVKLYVLAFLKRNIHAYKLFCFISIYFIVRQILIQLIKKSCSIYFRAILF